jgi:hypothetical protein
VTPLCKNGYIIPTIVHTRYVDNSLNSSSYLFCAFITDPAFDSSFFLLVDAKLNIINVSQNCATEFAMVISHLQKTPQMKHWFQDLPEKAAEWKNSRFVLDLVHKNPKTGLFEKEKSSSFHVEIVVWDLSALLDFRSMVIKLEKVVPAEDHSGFTMLDINGFKLRDKTMERYIVQAQHDNGGSSLKQTGIRSMAGTGASAFQPLDDDAWFDQYFFKNIKLLKMKKNRLFEIDFTQIDNLEDKEVLNDEFEQFCIDSAVELGADSEADVPREAKRSIKYDFQHPKKFRRFIDLYHKNFSVPKLIFLFFFAVFLYLGFILGNIQFDHSTQQTLVIFENMSIVSSIRLNQMLLTAQDIQAAAVSTAKGVRPSNTSLLGVASRIRDRVAIVRNCSSFLTQNQAIFRPDVSVTVFQDTSDNTQFDFYVLEQWLLAKMTQLADPNVNATVFRAAVTGSNNLTSFILQNVLRSYHSGSLEILSGISNAKQQFVERQTFINLLFKSVPMTLLLLFIGVYFYFLSNVNAKNLRLLTIFLQVPDSLIENQIAKIQRLLLIIKKILFEEKIADSTETNAAVARTKTIYRKKLFKNHKDLCNLRTVLLISIPLFLMIAYNLAEHFLAQQYLGLANAIISNGYVPDYQHKILADFNTVFTALLPFSLPDIPTPAITLASAGSNLTSTVNLIFYQFIQGSSIYSANYCIGFSQAFFGDACTISEVFPSNATVAACQIRFATFGNPSYSSIVNLLAFYFYSFQAQIAANKLDATLLATLSLLS